MMGHSGMLTGHLKRWLVLPVLTVSLILPPVPPAAGAALKSGDAFPKTALADRAGMPVTLPDDVKGKVVLIHFWATWCPFCIKEIRALETIYGMYRDKGLVPFSVNVGEDNQTVASFLKSETVSYPILMDRNSEAARQVGVTGLPTTFICGRDGVIRFKIIGEINKGGLERLLATLL
jgi:cytochrome c biogenesis protein CcmG, thiol:disulfide interchange protein DsbE